VFHPLSYEGSIGMSQRICISHQTWITPARS
jgi:hypothetical protein